MSALQRMNLSQTNRPCDVIKHWMAGGEINLNPPYQRGDVWSDERRRNLIKSVLLGVPIPSIIINDRFNAGWKDDTSIAVIDGKQRITSFLKFFSDELWIPGEWLGLSGNILYSQLPVVTVRRIHNQPMAFSEGHLKTMEEEIEVFNLVNYGGVPQGQSDYEGGEA